MSPPVYGDLGKGARDLFSKGYHFNTIKLELKTKTPGGVQFTTGGNTNTDTGCVTGQLETKYKVAEHGLTLTEKWTTDNQLTATLDLQDKIIKGLKLTFDSKFSPQTGSKSGVVKAEYKHDAVAVNLDADMNMCGPLVNASAVLGHQGWLAGYQMAFDTGKYKLVKNNFGVGYSSPNFVLHTSVNDGQVFGGSVYQKVRPGLETGVNLGWSAGKNETTFGIGCKYALDDHAFLRAKINSSSLLGLGYQQKLRDGVSLFLSAQIDGRNFHQGGHKLGIALEMEA